MCNFYGVTCNGGTYSIHLPANNLVGPIPPQISTLPIVELVLSNNGLTGAIPAINESIQVLDLSHNALSGGLPVNIESLRSLKTLLLNDNELLKGRIPQNIGNLNQLVSLDLSSSSLDGVIPPTVGSLVQLKDLILYNNKITGSFPSLFSPEIVTQTYFSF